MHFKKFRVLQAKNMKNKKLEGIQITIKVGYWKFCIFVNKGFLKIN